MTKLLPKVWWRPFWDTVTDLRQLLNVYGVLISFYRAMHFSANARSWDRMSSVCPSVCNVGGL